MTRTTDDPHLAQLAQQALEAQGLYEGAIDGIWGPRSDAGFLAYSNANLYADASKLTLTLSAGQQADLAIFLKNWKTPSSQERYRVVAAATDTPSELVAALHYRECPDFPAFGTYLHNGNPLGQPTVNEPRGILFQSWTSAAVDAIEREHTARNASGLDRDCRVLAMLCIFAEHYNGEGYRELGVPDPYVLAGTSGYTKGKFVKDGVYDPDAVDQELGILPILRAIL